MLYQNTQYDETELLRLEGVNHLYAFLNVILTALMKHYLICMLFLSLILWVLFVIFLGKCISNKMEL